MNTFFTYFVTITSVIVVSFFLFFPWNKKIYEDGGTLTYSSLTYEIIIWRSVNGKNDIEFYFFPENFKKHVY